MPEVSLTTLDLITLAAYLLLMVGVGFLFSRGEKTSENYLLGGRRVAWWAVGISTMMSVVSTVSLVAVPGEVFNNGLSMLMTSLLYPFMSVIAFYLFIRFYFKLGSFTPFDYLQRRFGTSVRLTISTLYIFTRLIYVAMVLFASAKIFESAAGWSVPTTVVVVGIIGIVYTMLGGIRAVIWTDVIQFFVLFGGILVVVWQCVEACDGGLAEVIHYAFENGRGPERYAESDFYSLNPYVRLSFWLLLTFALLEPIFYNSADQITVQRLLSTSSYKNAKRAIYTNAIIILPITFVPWLIGLAIFTYYSQNPDPRVTSGDAAFFMFVSTNLPSPLPGLILASMLAAAMSTLDSAMNSLSAVLVKDFYLQGKRAKASEGMQVLLARVLTVCIGVLGAAFAIAIEFTSSSLRESIIEIGAIWGSFAIVLGPVYLLGVTSHRITARVVWVGILVCWGSTLGMVCWYVRSKMFLDTGPALAAWWAVPLVVVALSMVAYVLTRRSHHRHAFALIGVTAGAAGFCVAGILWYAMSHATGGGELSFLWISFPGLILMLLICYGSIPVLPEPTSRRHVGLTLRTSHQDLEV